MRLDRVLVEENWSAEKYIDNHPGLKTVYGKVKPLQKFMDELKNNGSRKNKALDIRDKKELPKADNHPLVPMNKKVDFKCKNHENINLKDVTPSELLKMDKSGEKLCPKNDEFNNQNMRSEVKMSEIMNDIFKASYKNTLLQKCFIRSTELDGKFRFKDENIKGFGGRNILDADVYIGLYKPVEYKGKKINGFAIMPDGKAFHEYNPKFGDKADKQFTKTLYNDNIRHTSNSVVVFNIPYTKFDDKIKYKNRGLIPVEEYFKIVGMRIASNIYDIVNNDNNEKELDKIFSKRKQNAIKHSEHKIKMSGMSDDDEGIKRVRDTYDKMAAAKKFINEIKNKGINKK